MSLDASDRAKLRQFLITSFGLSDLKDLAFDLGVDSESLSHDNKQELVRELIFYFERRDKLNILISEALKHRPNNDIRQLLAKLPSPNKRFQKVEIIMMQDFLEDTPQFIAHLATKLNCTQDDIVLIGIARGSLRLLISLPEEATQTLTELPIHYFANDQYQISSITAFDELDTVSKQTWRTIINNKPYIQQGQSFYPSISWEEASKGSNKSPLSAQHTSSGQAPIAEKPGLWVGVPPMPNHFIGRDEQIADLVQRLTSGESLALSAEGLAGVGKTTLAVALAHRRDVLEHFEDGVLWAGLGRQADVLSVLNTWAEALEIDVSGLTEDVARQQAVRDQIGQRRLLLVIDDVWDIQAAERLRCGGPYCCHLLTTRDKGIARQFAGLQGMHSVQLLEDDPAFALLQQLAPEACAADPQAARALAQAVGGLPLALELLGSYLALPRRNLHPKLSREAMSRLMDPRHRLQLAKERLGTPGQEVTLHDTILLSLEGLRELEDGEAAERAFYALGAFAPKPEQFSWEAAKAVTEVEVEILALLIEQNLLEKADEQLTLHQTLSDVARTRIDDAAIDRHQDYYLKLVNEDRNNWQRIERVYRQLQRAWQAAVIGADERLLDFVHAVRNYQWLQGFWQDYIKWVEQALKYTRTTGNRKNEGMLLNDLGLVYDRLGKWEVAKEYYSQALPILNEIGDQVGIAATLNNLGLVYYHIGQVEEALRYFHQALPIAEEADDRLGQAATLNNLGLTYDRLGKGQEALENYHQALSILEEVGARAKLATTLNNLGLVYDRLGEWEQALEYYNQSLPIREEVGDRAGQATTLTNLGRTYDRLGQQEKALEVYTQALLLMEQVGDRIGQATTLNNLGLLYTRLGYWSTALTYLNQALPLMIETGDQYGESITHYNIAKVLREEGRLAEAVAHLTRTVELDRLVQHPDLQSDMALLAQVETELEAQKAAD